MVEFPCQLTPTFTDYEPLNLYDGPQPVRITLLSRIHGGPRCWSQVYRAEVDSWNKSASEFHPPAGFVLKLYVPSELPSHAEWDPYCRGHLGSDAEEKQREMITREARAYRALVGCPVTPKWFGTYQFTLPSGEISVGTLLEYIDGEPLSDEYILNANGETRPFSERMITAAVALDQLHSYGVGHGDIREPNIIVITSPQEPFPMRFVDFGASAVYERDELIEESAQFKFEDDARNLMHLVLGYFDLDAASSRPLLRTIPRQGAIVKFLEAWDTRATYEEQVEAAVTEIMARGVTDETMVREMVLEYVK
ncbi:hypothetical protein BDV93DRAFT_558494 [Ceratobasidium sp. AG-I]|nr:hypothetical protein BDV93DRAFT_558494 [Ceratobasidium sp. AG-I]